MPYSLNEQGIRITIFQNLMSKSSAIRAEDHSRSALNNYQSGFGGVAAQTTLDALLDDVDKVAARIMGKPANKKRGK